MPVSSARTACRDGMQVPELPRPSHLACPPASAPTFAAALQRPNELMNISHAVKRVSVAGSQSSGNSFGLSRRTLPRLDEMPASTIPDTLVFFALGKFRRHRTALRKAQLVEPSECPATIRVEIALLRR